QSKPRTQAYRIAAGVLGGVGVVSIGVGLAFGVRAMTAKSNSEGHCTGNDCDPDGLALRAQGIADGNRSTAFVLGGLAGVCTGAAIFFFGPPATSSNKKSVRLAPTPAGAVILGNF